MSTAVNDIPDIEICKSCHANRLCLSGAAEESRGLEAPVEIIKQQRTLQRGEYLFRAGDEFHAIYAVCRGSTKTCVVDDDGGMQITGFQLPGELVGLYAMGDRQHQVDAVALEPTVVCEIPYYYLEKLSEREPEVMRKLLDVMATSITASQDEIITVVGNQNAASSLASFLCALSQRSAGSGKYQTELHLPMSRNDISNYLGLAKETVSRLFARFERDRLIASRYKQISLLDVAKLKRLAGCRHLSSGVV